MFKLALILATLTLATTSYAETYTIDGTKGQTKLKAIVALASNKTAKVERCTNKDGQDDNVAKMSCRLVELGPRGTLRLAK